MEYINEFHKQWIERTRKSIALWSKQPASLEATRTFGPTESYKKRQIEELIHLPIQTIYGFPLLI